MVDLKPLSAIGMIDRALAVVREGGRAVIGPALLGGAIFASVPIALYYVERVEGIHGLRLPFALALVLAWGVRAFLLSRACRAIVDAHGMDDLSGAGRPFAVLRTATVTAITGWIYVWILVLGTMAGPIGVLFVLPAFATRGAFAPSWLARAGCDPRAGLRAYRVASADSAGVRFRGLMTESMLLLGCLGLAINLYVAAMFAVFLLHAVVGLEVTDVESFLSVRNTFVLILVAAAALVIFEPVRAAVSALSYLDARVRRDGLDLRRSVEEAILLSSDPEERRRRARINEGRGIAAVAIGFVLVMMSAPAHAQPPVIDDPIDLDRVDREGEPRIPAAAREDAPAEWELRDGDAPPFVLSDQDRAVQTEVETVLARPEFQEFEDTRGAGVGRLIERLVEWLLRLQLDLEPFGNPHVGQLSLPPIWVFIVLAVLAVIAVLVYLFVTRRREKRALRASIDVEVALRDRTPRSLMDEAAMLAEAGDLRAALRSLYVATLVALDRRHLIAFDPHLTNWQYLRQMPRGAAWDAFRSFTRLFDHKWYGREPTTRDDYDQCRDFASRIVEGGSA